MKNIIASQVLSTMLARATKALPMAVIGASVAVVSIAPAQAVDITDAAVQRYASAMKTAANQQNINAVASLVSDDALISLSRRGRTTSLDKVAYLDLLRDSWRDTSNYSYNITITNIVTTGETAKADVNTVESWTRNGEQTTVTTSARATLASDSNNAVLLRAVAQVSIN